MILVVYGVIRVLMSCLNAWKRVVLGGIDADCYICLDPALWARYEVEIKGDEVVKANSMLMNCGVDKNVINEFPDVWKDFMHQCV
jgi:hypothetical protein